MQFDPDKVEVCFVGEDGNIWVYKDGKMPAFDEERATKLLSQPEVTVLVDMKMGSESATAWGCDLSYDYVKINADYRS